MGDGVIKAFADLLPDFEEGFLDAGQVAEKGIRTACLWR